MDETCSFPLVHLNIPDVYQRFISALPSLAPQQLMERHKGVVGPVYQLLLLYCVGSLFFFPDNCKVV